MLSFTHSPFGVFFFIFHVSCLKISLFFLNSASWNTRLLLASPSSHTHGVLDLSLTAVYLSFATFSHCTASCYPLWLSQRTGRQWLCAAGVWQVTGGTDFTETGCHFCKVLPLSVWRRGEIGGPTSHYLCSHKALTSSAACNCFDNLITSNCCGGKFISGWHIIALSRVSVLKAVIRIRRRPEGSLTDGWKGAEWTVIEVTEPWHILVAQSIFPGDPHATKRQECCRATLGVRPQRSGRSLKCVRFLCEVMNLQKQRHSPQEIGHKTGCNPYFLPVYHVSRL